MVKSGAPEEPSGAPEEPSGAPEHSEERDAKRRCATEPEREYHELFAMLSRRAPTTKEIESAVAGEPPCVVERSLPSFFDSYPRSKRAALVLAEAGRWDDALRLLRESLACNAETLVSHCCEVRAEQLDQAPDLALPTSKMLTQPRSLASRVPLACLSLACRLLVACLWLS